MYNSRYQGFTPPTRPIVHAVTGQGKVNIYWDDAAEYSRDVVTGYADFEGYKIYKSTDGGTTWGSATDIIYDDKGQAVGWRPYAQFHLTEEEDSNSAFILLTKSFFSDSFTLTPVYFKVSLKLVTTNLPIKLMTTCQKANLMTRFSLCRLLSLSPCSL